MAECDVIVNGLNVNEAPWSVQRDGTSVSPPPLKRQTAGSLYHDGEEITAAAYGNREIVLRVMLDVGEEGDASGPIAALDAALQGDEETGRFDVEWGPGGVTFNAWRSPDYTVEMQDFGVGVHIFVLRILADPLGES